VLDGADVALNPEASQGLSMALHELTTNAIKHGALSVATGRVDITTELSTAREGDRSLQITWREVGGPPVVAPKHSGYGLAVIQELLAYELDARVDVAFERGGVRCTISLPLDRIALKPREWKLRSR
jgi:two-component sensor histidine kinase